MAYKIGHDKKKHFLVGIPLGVLLQYLLSVLLPHQPILSTSINIVLLAGICYGFELFSLVTGRGHAENLDAIAGIFGGLIGTMLFWSIYLLL